jgi:putative component of membrane protein insertase Oxa1/YidC/SpoIIIJ protein YidD
VTRTFALAPIRFYRKFLTRFTPHCTLTPICSTYALQVVAQHGAGRGMWMAHQRAKTHPKATNVPVRRNSSCPL